MCTISWLNASDGLRVHFNRDEGKHREEGSPPHLWSGNPIPFIAPLDPREGGTWLAVSADGTIRALLNHDDCQHHSTSKEMSPGLVPYRLGSGEWKLDDLMENPWKIQGVAPFHLMIITAKEATRHTWDGASWQSGNEQFPIGSVSTSSWNSVEVNAFRKAAFARIFPKGGPLDPAGLERYHDGLETDCDPTASIRMDRDDSRTVSQTRIHIQGKRIAVSYRTRDPIGPGFSKYWSEIRLAMIEPENRIATNDCSQMIC